MNSPKEIANNYVPIGAAKTKIPSIKLFCLAVMAGIFVAIAGAAATTAAVSVPYASVGKLIGACIFPAGLAMVILAGSELFTGNCLIIISVLEKKATIMGMLKNLVIVYIGNFAGSILLSAMLAYSHVFSLFSEGLAQSCVSTAVGKVTLSFSDAFLKGILCNIFVCLAVWMAFAAKTAAGKIAALFYPILVFVLCGFEHCVANMCYIPSGLFAKSIYGIDAPALTWKAFAVNNLIPVTLGNIVGGVFIGAMYWFIYLHGEKKNQ